jgi:hypothetical protein
VPGGTQAEGKSPNRRHRPSLRKFRFFVVSAWTCGLHGRSDRGNPITPAGRRSAGRPWPLIWIKTAAAGPPYPVSSSWSRLSCASGSPYLERAAASPETLPHLRGGDACEPQSRRPRGGSLRVPELRSRDQLFRAASARDRPCVRNRPRMSRQHSFAAPRYTHQCKSPANAKAPADRPGLCTFQAS